MLALVLLLTAVSLFGCSSYTSSYKATLLVRSIDRNSARIDFYTLEGRLVFCLQSDKGPFSFSGKLGSGHISVYYDANGEKNLLFSLKGGDAVEAETVLETKGKVYVIIETDGKCENGSFSFLSSR